MKQTRLSEDEILRDWSLSGAGLDFVSKFKKQYRLWVYLQLCALRLFGQLLENPNVLDTRIISYACKSLRSEIIATVEIPARDATRTDYKKFIFSHLNFKQFNEAKTHFYRWLNQKVQTGMLVPEKLVPEAEAFLVANKIALPTMYYLKREITSFCSQHQEKLFTEIYQQLSKELIEAINVTLEIIPGEEVTWFQKFKEYPGASSIMLLQDYLQRYEYVEKINLASLDLRAFPLDLAKHLYQLTKHYDAYKIKRFQPPKRYTLMVLFLNESKKVLVDYVIQLHDQHISNICRECYNIHENNLRIFKVKNEKASDKIEKFVDFILAQEDEFSTSIGELYARSTKKSDLQQARDDMHQYRILSRFGYANLIQNRYSSMRRYFVDFIQLPFLSEKGSDSLRKAINWRC